jgi:hypothetical protein
LFISRSPGVRRGHDIEKYIYICFYLKKSSFPEPDGQFQPNLGQIILKEWEFEIVQIKGQVLFKGGIITKVKK